MFTYKWNNFLHSQILGILNCVFSADSSFPFETCEPGQEEDTDRDAKEILIKHVTFIFHFKMFVNQQELFAFKLEAEFGTHSFYRLFVHACTSYCS